MQHSAARKYVPVYERTRIERVYQHFPHAGKDVLIHTQERGNVDFWGARKCRKPKIAYTILRIAKARAGQLELFPVLRKKVKRSKKGKRLKYA